ncbi:hypothetical protein F5887DRAFT_1129720 [Amanita rubescens]|nr:hypothetical protein F5887DRAFT_1129720 [Amanita rubescens]
MTNSSPSSSIHQNVVPSEVGWQFVPQYYTFVNKHPNRLHCFYTKQSTFIHGTEGEDCKPCFGQHEIHQKITSIGFQDCKVFIHSVDAQSSANGGIIIQVIGEMSNHAEPWRKFVQTFFLAEQPNGYFVLNDIFRFLKEEAVETDEPTSDDVDVEPVPATAEPAPTLAHPVPIIEPVREPTPPPAAPVPLTEEAPTTDSTEVQAPTPESQVQVPSVPETNGIQVPESEKHSPAPVEKPLTPAPPPPQQLTPAAAVAPPASQPPPPAVAPPLAASTSTASTSAQAPAVSAASSAPRSWASLAASNPKKWGSTVATDSRGTTEVPASSASPAPASGTHTPPTAGQPSGGRPSGQQSGQGRSEHHPSYIAAQSVTTPHCFVKVSNIAVIGFHDADTVQGVSEQLSNNLLAATLTQRFGPVKEVEVVRSKMCAFIEFQSLDSARRAITASLPHNQGGEGGLFIDVGGDAGQVRIVVETKKDRADRPPGRGRPPTANGGEGRGAGGGGGGGGHGPGGGQGGYGRRGGVGRGRGSGPK